MSVEQGIEVHRTVNFDLEAGKGRPAPKRALAKHPERMVRTGFLDRLGEVFWAPTLDD
jgi:hypothetical protein